MDLVSYQIKGVYQQLVGTLCAGGLYRLGDFKILLNNREVIFPNNPKDHVITSTNLYYSSLRVHDFRCYGQTVTSLYFHLIATKNEMLLGHTSPMTSNGTG